LLEQHVRRTFAAGAKLTEVRNTLYFRQNGNELILVSEPFDKRPDWEEVPINHAVLALASKPVEIVPLFIDGSWKSKEEQLRIPRVNARA
jgi:hypothetical protein